MHRLTERNRPCHERQVDRAIARKADGEKLRELCGLLIGWSAQPAGTEVHAPQQGGPRGVRGELVRTREAYSRQTFIDPARLTDQKLQREVFRRVPSLTEPMTGPEVAFTKLKSNPGRAGDYFLALALDEETGSALQAERNQTWQALAAQQGIAVDTPCWSTYRPSFTLLHLPATEPETINRLKVVIKSFLPMPVSLDPAAFPVPDRRT